MIFRVISLLLALTLSASAQVGGLAFPGPGPNVASGSSFSLTEQSNNGSGTTGTTTISYGTFSYTSGCNALVLLIYWYNSSATDTVSSISATAGTAAQVLAGAAKFGNTNGQQNGDIWEILSPTGTSTTISVTYSANVTFNSNVTVYCLKSSHTTATAAVQNATAGGSPSVTTPSLTIPGGGGAIVMASSGGGHVLTFTNATPDTGSPYTGGGTYDAWGTVTATGTITATPTAGDALGIAAVAFQP